MSIYRRSLAHGLSRIFSLPRLSLPLIVTLGLTLGAVLAVVSIVSVLMFKPLPGIKDEQQLHNASLRLGITDALRVSFFNWRRMADFRRHFADYGEWAAVSAGEAQTVIDDVDYPVTRLEASANILDVLGTPLLLGDGTDREAPEESVWISNSLWQSAFGGRESVLGKTVKLGDKSYPVAGVISDLSAIASDDPILPQQVWRIQRPDSFLAQPEQGQISGEVGSVILRSSQGKTPSESEIRQWLDGYIDSAFEQPEIKEFIRSQQVLVQMSSYRNSIVSEIESLVVMLFAAVTGLLVMASLNLLNLFIAHYQGRAKEFAIQISLGAKLMRMRGMIFLENLPSFLTAAVLGLLVAGWGIRGLPVIAGDTLPMLEQLSIDGSVVVVALVIVVVLAALFSLVALVNIARQSLNTQLNSSGKGLQGQHKQWLSRSLMVLQLSLASVLLTGSVMLAKQSYDAVYQDLGYDYGNSFAVSWAYGDETWAEQISDFDSYAGSEYQQVRESLADAIEKAFSGSEVVIAGTSPLSNEIRMRSTRHPETQQPLMYLDKDLTDNYFNVFDIELLAGVLPTEAQLRADEKVVVVDERMARAAYPGVPLSEVVGKTLQISREGTPPVIAAVVANTLPRAGSLDEFTFPTLYTREIGAYERLNLTVRMPDGSSLDAAAIEDAIGAQFPRLVDTQVRSLEERWLQQTTEQRVSLAVILSMTGLTLLLAVIGVAGLTQMTTNQQRYELAVRMATGARQSRLLKLVFKDAGWMLAAGLSLGFVVSVLGYTEIRERVSMMPVFDWQSMAVLDTALVLIVAVAVALPAWRIIKADPMQALREL